MKKIMVAPSALGMMAAGLLYLALAGCGGDSTGTPASSSTSSTPVPPKAITGVSQTAVATFNSPWGMDFLPDGRLLVTERVFDAYEPGAMWLVTQAGVVSAPLTGLPENYGVLGVVPGPNYNQDRFIYFSYLEPGDPTAPRVGRGASDLTLSSTMDDVHSTGLPSYDLKPMGLAVARAQLAFDKGSTPALVNLQILWHQFPTIVSNHGSGEPGGQIVFSPDKKQMFVIAGDRQEFGPAQTLDNTLGKVIRLNLDGSIPADNPYVSTPSALPEIWAVGLRNPYGVAFDAAGTMWEAEHGPEGGDELNVIESAKNYGWPNVSYGDHYGGGLIAKPAPGDGYAPAAEWWTPAIAPSSMLFYNGSAFAAWKGDLLISGLVSKAIIRVHISGNSVANGTGTEVQRIDMQERMRAVAQAPDGSLWVLQDGLDRTDHKGQLIKLAPVF